MRIPLCLTGILIMTMTACNSQKETADVVFTGGRIYCVDGAFSTAEAMAVGKGTILETGTNEEITARYRSDETVDLGGRCVYPGWIDAHCHFYGYGTHLGEADLTGTRSLEEVQEVLAAYGNPGRGQWITGRGWDQNDWPTKAFPHRSDLEGLYPDTPVMLTRIDGHAAWVNTAALELAGITSETRVDGGTVLTENGKPTGILIDNAISLVESLIPAPAEAAITQALLRAQDSCFAVGLTSVQDAGLQKKVVEQVRGLHREGSLKIRINAWLSPTEENYRTYVENGPYQDQKLTINTIKLFSDGALGSRGAWMIDPYSDDPDNCGLAVTPMEEIESHCRRAYEYGYAVATHCIGDRANREVLRLYARILGGENQRRWRIEHAQIIHPSDFHYFSNYSIVPSVQTVHATSDMYWAEDRLGAERLKGAYAFSSLLRQNGWIANGSDFPVEHINPLYGFYAAVARKDQQGRPEGGYLAEEALSREEALRSMTIWAARAGGEETLKGSLEAGKLADFVVTDKDLMTVPEEELFRIRVLSTWVGGEKVFGDEP